MNLILWTWPEGFGKKALDAVAAEFPQYKVRQDVIGGDFKQKLTTTFTAGSGLPDITGVKGEDIAFFKSQSKYFVDLNTLGAEDIKGDYLEYKWAQATTEDGKQLGIPIDIGPTALFYRFDIFEEAGLPSDPKEPAAAIRTWDEYIEPGQAPPRRQARHLPHPQRRRPALAPCGSRPARASSIRPAPSW